MLVGDLGFFKIFFTVYIKFTNSQSALRNPLIRG